MKTYFVLSSIFVLSDPNLKSSWILYISVKFLLLSISAFSISYLFFSSLNYLILFNSLIFHKAYSVSSKVSSSFNFYYPLSLSSSTAFAASALTELKIKILFSNLILSRFLAFSSFSLIYSSSI